MEAQGFINPFKGKIVVIGTSLAEEQDFKPTPYLSYKGKEYQFPGVEYHANAIQHMLDGNYIQSPFGSLEYHQGSVKWHLIVIIVLIIITLIFVSKAPPLWGFAVMAIEVIAWTSYAVGAFLTHHLWLYKLLIYFYS